MNTHSHYFSVTLFNLPENKISLCHNQCSNSQHSFSHGSALILNQTASSVFDNKVRLCHNPPDWRSVENHSRAHGAFCCMCCCRWSQRLARMDVTNNQLRNYLPPINRWSFTGLWVGKKHPSGWEEGERRFNLTGVKPLVWNSCVTWQHHNE